MAVNVADATPDTTDSGGDAEFRDVVIIGAGLSGVDAAYRIGELLPKLSYALLERRERVGGTWDLFRYPGIRSDSDIFTFSLPFSEWTGETTIADGADIRNYIWDTAKRFGIDKNIRFSTYVQDANFDSGTDTWTVRVLEEGAPKTYECRFLFFCTGYYDYDGGYTPEFPGINDFGGTVVHPQQWPEDLDYTDKKVVVIGSGATAVTLVPSMADDAKLVTMLQRSPTYIASLPSADPLTLLTQRVLPAKLAHDVNRWRWAVQMVGVYQFMRRAPKLGRKMLQGMAKAQLPNDYEVDVHFKPKYDPWDQRLCVVPNGDLFKAIRAGKAEVVTDHIDHFTATGIKLKSGAELDADIIVTATGLKVQALGGIDVAVDGEPVKINDRFVYRGHMLEGVPNAAWTIGYTNASWTLTSDLTSRSVARLLAYMDKKGFTRAVPDLGGEVLTERPAIDLMSGYIQRAVDVLPKSGVKRPWAVRQNYLLDFADFKSASVTEAMTFSTNRKAKTGSKVAG